MTLFMTLFVLLRALKRIRKTKLKDEVWMTELYGNPIHVCQSKDLGLICPVLDMTMFSIRIYVHVVFALIDSDERESFRSTKFGGLDIRESSRVCSKEV